MRCADYRAFVASGQGVHPFKAYICFWTWPWGHCYHRESKNVQIIGDIICCNCPKEKRNVMKADIYKYPPPEEFIK